MNYLNKPKVGLKTHHAENLNDASKFRWYESKDGFFLVPRAIREDSTLSNAEFRVLICLASYIFNRDQATPSLETLGAFCNMTDSTISRATKGLQEKGWITKIKRPYNSVLYLIHLPERFKKSASTSE